MSDLGILKAVEAAIRENRSVLLFPYSWPIILEQDQELAFQLADVLKLHMR